jgi:glucosamine-6-phosphate deaminase
MAPPSLLVLDDHRHVGLTAAELVANRVRARTHMRVLLPTGHTPVGLYAALRDHAADGSLPTDRVTVLGLDEYLGLGQDDPRSFRATLDRELAGLRIGRREALDGAALDPEAEAVRYQAVLDTAPVDLAVLGLGRDAHVAFNEPGSRPADGVRRVTLDPSTIAAAAGDFGGTERVPRQALTVGPDAAGGTGDPAHRDGRGEGRVAARRARGPDRTRRARLAAASSPMPDRAV